MIGPGLTGINRSTRVITHPTPPPPNHAHSSSTQYPNTGIESGLPVVCFRRAHGDVDDDRLHGQHGAEQPPRTQA